jgi:hypothetical protein
VNYSASSKTLSPGTKTSTQAKSMFPGALWQIADRSKFGRACALVKGARPSGQFKIEGENENEKELSEKGIEAGQREAVEVSSTRQKAVIEALTAES